MREGPETVTDAPPSTEPRSSVDLHDPHRRHQIEASLTALPGVRAARLVPGFERAVDELHVVTDTERAAKQVVRDIQTTLMAQHGVPTDHRVISVAQISATSPAAVEPRRSVTVHRVGVAKEGLVTVAEVVLSGPDGESEGRDEGPSSAPGRRRAVARATLAALRSALPADRQLEVEGVDVVELLGTPVVVCLVHVHSTAGGRTRSGSAVVDGDENDAVARSVLDATNRLASVPERR